MDLKGEETDLATADSESTLIYTRYSDAFILPSFHCFAFLLQTMTEEIKVTHHISGTIVESQ